MEKKCYLVKDDFDEKSVCVVITKFSEVAIRIAKEKYANAIEGDLYAVELPLHESLFG